MVSLSDSSLNHEENTSILDSVVEESEIKKEIAPEDKGQFVMITCIMLGVAVLFPWNALITANTFWTETFGDESNFVFYLSAVFNWPQWITLLLVTVFGPRFGFDLRILATMGVYCVTLLFIPGVCTLDINTDLQEVLTLIAAFITGLSGAILMGSTLGFVSIFPARYITGAMSGMGIGGVIIGLLAALAELLFSDNGTLQAWVYFGSAVLIVIATIIMYIAMVRTPYAKFYLMKYEQETKLQQEQSSSTSHEFSYYFSIFKKIWIDALSVWFVFFISLSLFPGMMLQVVPTYASVAWYNLLIPLEFNFFDMLGRTLPYWFVIPPKFVWPPTVARVAFYPLIIVCVLGVLPSSELWMYFFNALFAISNGFLGTLCMMYAPQKVSNEEQQTTGIMMSFFLNFGIFCATNFAVLLSYVVNQF